MKYINVHILKELYKTGDQYHIRIRDTYINKAKNLRKKLKISVGNYGVGIYTWQEWMANAEHFEQVFLRPDEPMVLIGNLWKAGHGLEDNRETKRIIEDVSIPKDIKLRLGEIFRSKYGKSDNNLGQV